MLKHNHVKVTYSRIKVAPKFLQKVTEIVIDSEEPPTNECRIICSQSPHDSFREATRFPLLLGQWLCLIPFSHSKFKWISFRLFILLVVTGCQVGMTIFSLLWLNRGRISIFKTGTVLFFSGAAIMMMLMIRLSYMWPTLTNKWMEIEEHFGYHTNLKRTFAVISTLIIVFSTVEHLSNLLFDMFFSTSQSSKHMVVMIYMTRTFPQIFRILECSLWRAILVLYINSVSTLVYSFGDQLIIMISLALGNYFEKYNKTILELRGKPVSEQEWKILRRKYTKLCELTYVVDDCLCHLLCLTFLIHLYIICVGMHQGMLYTSDGWNKIHAFLSFTSSVLRACALCYTTVRIYEQSRTVLEVLYSVPSSSYCAEIELFTQQVLQNETVLSGSHMFAMKRQFLLTIGGTIVSYEILLMQMKDFSHYEVSG